MDLGGPRVSRSLPRIDWNAQLPYLALSSSRLFPSATPENETCDSLLRDICSGLVAAAEEGDWFGGRLESDARVGVIGWTTRLQGYCVVTRCLGL